MSPLQMPPLETERLVIRPFETGDLAACDRLFRDLWDEPARPDWMEWASRNAHEMALLYQPPIGDRALILRETGELIGSAGLVPAVGPFELLTGEFENNAEAARNTLEMGLFWALATPRRGKGYATEAARALIDYAFGALNLRRIVATTEFDNAPSQAVMRRLDMDEWRNPHGSPPWFQFVGLLKNEKNDQQEKRRSMKGYRALVPLAALGFGLTYGAALCRAQVPPPAAVPKESVAPFLRATRYEAVQFSRSPQRTLHTWYVESRGVGLVEARLWYIAGGKANLRDQCVFWWDNKTQTGTWRLMLLEQAAPQPTLLPSYEITAVFDNPKDAPDTKATGLANADARKPVRLSSALNAVTHINRNNPPGIPPNRAALLYAAQSLRQPGDKSVLRQLRADDPFPIDTLTKQSRTPGKAFLVLALTWVRPKSTASKASAAR